MKTRSREYFYEIKTNPSPLQRLLLSGTHDALDYDRALDVNLSAMEKATERFCSFVIMLGCLVWSILGGMATLTLLQVYLFNFSTWGRVDLHMLQLYSPQALVMNRLYWVLIMIALCNAVCRYGIHTAALPQLSKTQGTPCGPHLGMANVQFSELITCVSLHLLGISLSYSSC